MKTDRELMKQALHALEIAQVLVNHRNYFINPAITASKEALAQPEQKWVYGTPLLDAMSKDYVAPQRPWVGLTKVDILAASQHWRNSDDFAAGVDWAEASLKEKNT